MDALSTLCMDAHLTPDAFMTLVGISRRTFYRWQHNPPQWAIVLLRVLSGDLEPIHATWAGWVINERGELCTPNNYVFLPGDIHAIFWERQLNRALKVKIQQLEKQLTTAHAGASDRQSAKVS